MGEFDASGEGDGMEKEGKGDNLTENQGWGEGKAGGGQGEVGNVFTSDDKVQGSTLQGASSTSGGVIRGKAYGNVLSHQDMPEIQGEVVKPVKGEVRVFTSLIDPTNIKPTLIVKVNTDPNLVQVLKQIKKKYTPNEAQNPRIYLLENGNWCVKGQYKDIFEDDDEEEEVEWSYANGKLSISICLEYDRPQLTLHTISQSLTPVTPSGSLTPITPSGTITLGSVAPESQAVHGQLSTQELIAILEIPEQLIGKSTKDAGLKVYYANRPA
ncbi:hypothetical protein APHAL10511_003932 [Amanita phalloides]|nr:hypothetical protein APHAL10511_003932 [Amanita phalloides]